MEWELAPSGGQSLDEPRTHHSSGLPVTVAGMCYVVIVGGWLTPSKPSPKSPVLDARQTDDGESVTNRGNRRAVAPPGG